MIKEININEWQLFSEESNCLSPFLHKQWLLLISSQYKLPVKILGYYENEQLVSAIPFVEKKSFFNRKKLISLPFTDYISFQKNLPENFIKQLKEYSLNKYTSVEIRNQVQFTDNSNSTFYRHYLNLESGYENLKTGFKKNNKRNIKKADKNNLTIKISKELKSIEEFYKLNILTRKKHGLPPQPKSFFHNITKYLFENNLGFVATVYMKEKAISSSIFFTFKNSILYKYGASDYKYIHLRPNNLLFDSILKYACENNFAFFDFGICSKENTGLRRFKNGWGASEENISYVLINKNGVSSYNKRNYNVIFYKIFKILPSKLNVFLGEFLYKYMV